MQPDSWKQPVDFSQILEHYLCFYCDERETRWAKVLLCKRYKLSWCYERNCIRNKKAAANRGSFVDFSIHWLDKIIPTTFLMHPRSRKKHLTLLNFIISDVMIHAGEWLTKVHSHYDRPPPHLQIYIFFCKCMHSTSRLVPWRCWLVYPDVVHLVRLTTPAYWYCRVDCSNAPDSAYSPTYWRIHHQPPHGSFRACASACLRANECERSYATIII